MGAPVGNRNAAKGAEFANALERAYKKFATKTVKRGQVLEAIGTKLLQLALCGNVDAIKLVAERLDGKPRFSLEIEGTPEGTPKVIVYLPDNGRGPQAASDGKS